MSIERTRRLASNGKPILLELQITEPREPDSGGSCQVLLHCQGYTELTDAERIAIVSGLFGIFEDHLLHRAVLSQLCTASKRHLELWVEAKAAWEKRLEQMRLMVDMDIDSEKKH